MNDLSHGGLKLTLNRKGRELMTLVEEDHVVREDNANLKRRIVRIIDIQIVEVMKTEKNEEKAGTSRPDLP